mmetsp:Transcript_25594/g.67926  ORF Transcript_25594/g.67926 Transcript_25594/m.67926 type:complete len:388 (+) Transcript_25594:992-2155(+)
MSARRPRRHRRSARRFRQGAPLGAAHGLDAGADVRRHGPLHTAITRWRRWEQCRGSLASSLGAAQPIGAVPGGHLQLPGLAGDRQEPLQPARQALRQRGPSLAALGGSHRHSERSASSDGDPPRLAQRRPRRPRRGGAEPRAAAPRGPPLVVVVVAGRWSRRQDARCCEMRVDHRCELEPRRWGELRELRRGRPPRPFRGHPRWRRPHPHLRRAPPRRGRRRRRPQRPPVRQVPPRDSSSSSSLRIWRPGGRWFLRSRLATTSCRSSWSMPAEQSARRNVQSVRPFVLRSPPRALAQTPKTSSRCAASVRSCVSPWPSLGKRSRLHKLLLLPLLLRKVPSVSSRPHPRPLHPPPRLRSPPLLLPPPGMARLRRRWRRPRRRQGRPRS